MDVQVFPAFATPFGSVFIDDALSINRDLIPLITGLADKGDAHRNTTAIVPQSTALFESTFDFFARPEPCVQQLRVACWAALSQVLTATLKGGVPADLSIGSQTWFHVTQNGGHFDFHNHPLASWSGVYCVDDGAPDPGRTNNGTLIFPHPLVASNMYLDAANAQLAWPFDRGNYCVDLKPGQLLLFPSWLGHYVAPFFGARPRITVAFNTSFR